MGIGGYAFVDPFAWFHHAAGDWLRVDWQARNPHLRATAYGYPAEPAYDLSPIALHDCVGCAAFGLGFSIGLDGVFSGSHTTADVLCGEIESIYTYDTVLARHQAAEQLGPESTAAQRLEPEPSDVVAADSGSSPWATGSFVTARDQETCRDAPWPAPHGGMVTEAEAEELFRLRANPMSCVIGDTRACGAVPCCTRCGI